LGKTIKSYKYKVSHPSHKNKNVARVGHPLLWFEEGIAGQLLLPEIDLVLDRMSEGAESI
jgi:hypothetical protein